MLWHQALSPLSWTDHACKLRGKEVRSNEASRTAYGIPSITDILVVFLVSSTLDSKCRDTKV